MGVSTKTVQERFEVKYTPEPNTGCWLWTAATDMRGYGKMNIGGRTRVATHVALSLKGVEIPSGAVVCHRCDIPLCVNPDHLFLGSQRDNIADMHRKGRAAVGERMPVSKLSDTMVREIRRLKSEGAKQNYLARKFNVSPMTISRAVRGQSWSHV